MIGSGASATAQQGQSVALSADGNTAIVGGPPDKHKAGRLGLHPHCRRLDPAGLEAAASDAVGSALQGPSVALSADGNTAIVGGPLGDAGAAWVFFQPHALNVTPTTNVTASGNLGGPFFPSSFDYSLSSNTGSVDFLISDVPTWLTASATSGTVTTSPATVTFTINANSLQPGTYIETITFTNTTNGQGNQSRNVTLSVAAGATSIVAAVAPTARTTTVGATVTGFATIINAGTAVATACSIALPNGFPAAFLYQTTDPGTNVPTGTPNTPVIIAAGGAQSFYFAITPSTIFSEEIALVFQCSNTPNPAQSVAGLNTFLLTVSSTSIPDMLSIADTFTHDGNVVINGTNGIGLMVAASIDIGAAGTIVFAPTDTPRRAITTQSAAVTFICQTDASGNCVNPTAPGTSSTVNVANNQTRLFRGLRSRARCEYPL